MDYDIYIGDAHPITADDEENYLGLPWEVPEVELPDAPHFDGDDMTGHSNHRRPSYGVFRDWTIDVGVRELFFNNATGLMRQHPGVEPLTTEHAQTLKTARVRYEMAHPDVVPGWADGHDGDYARLLWFEWWMMTTLQTAEVPMLLNR